MNERDRPAATRETLRGDLQALGVETGTTLVVHSSLSAIGWVEGGAPTIVAALLDALGERGTLAMPAATPQCTDPAGPRFDRRRTATTMGAIAETFRELPATLRSDHPLESVCAHGPLAAEITGEHPLAFSEGPGTPFGKLHDLDARILLLGVGFNRCTALHHAETLAKKPRLMTVRIPTADGGSIEVQNVADDNDRLFPVVGEQYMAVGRSRRGPVGAAPSILCSMRDLVAFARDYFDSVL